MSELQIPAGYVWRRPGHASPEQNASVSVKDGLIEAVHLNGSAPSASGGRLLMPALVNAHDHGRALMNLAFGARDELYETWRGALYAQPYLDPYTSAAYAFGRMALAGIGTTLCVYSSINVERLADDAEAICRAARDVGIRLGFVVPLRNQNTMALGDDSQVLAMHDPADQDMIRNTWLYPWPTPKDYVALVRDIARRVEGPTVSVQYGPNSPHACSDDLIRAIAEGSAEDGRRIHAHFIETVPQREWADAHYPDGIVPHLDKLGWLSPRFTAAHAIWLNDEECSLFGSRGVTVAVNTSSNLRLYFGMSPIKSYIANGVGFGFGMDSFSIDDDSDMFRELRISHWIHAADHLSPRLTHPLLWDGALKTGFKIVMNDDNYGAIEPGMPADLLGIDYEAMSSDIVEGLVKPEDAMIVRATSRYVADLWVAGRQIVRDGRLTGLDYEALHREVMKDAKSQGRRMREMQPLLRRHQSTLRAFYDAGLHKRRTA